MTESSSRRDFVKKTGVAGTALLAGAYGLRAVSERMGHDPEPAPPLDLDVVRVALIGVGARGGGGHLQLLHRMPGVEITAVCDTNEAIARNHVEIAFADDLIRPGCEHREYPQLFPGAGFQPRLSALDLGRSAGVVHV
jgi:hypothetical protein